MKIKRKKFLVGLLNVVLATLGFLVIMLVFFNYWFSSTKVRDQIKMPDLVGSQVDTLQKFLDQHNLSYKITHQVDNWRLHKPAGTILTQIPEKEKAVKEGREVLITIVSKKLTDKAKMPRLVDKPIDIVEAQLKRIDLAMGKVTRKPFLGENIVMEQYYQGKKIEPETLVPKGSKIDLVVGDGLGEVPFKMPDLVGMKLEEAEKILKKLELLIGNITYVYNSSQKYGTVVRQNPTIYVDKLKKGVKQGRTLDERKRREVIAGELVDLWVSGTSNE